MVTADRQAQSAHDTVLGQYRRDGVVLLKGALSPPELALVLALFEHKLAHLTTQSYQLRSDNGGVFVTDAADPAIFRTPEFARVCNETRLIDLAARFLGGPDLWFYYEQLFYKHGGATRRTPWHQDTSYVPVEGPDIVRFWISFDPVDAAHALEFIRASHLGPLYNGSSFNPEDDTAPLFPHSPMPRLPDIQADREHWDIVSWAVEPGDIIAFHPSVLHGGAGTPPDRRRRSLSLVFFGDSAYFAPRPTGTVEANGADNPRTLVDMYAGLEPGDRFRLPHLPKLR
jgi:hypothetical protein